MNLSFPCINYSNTTFILVHQHYAGNRTRNAIVREDGPRAREEQRREEQDALEHRLRHLSLLQRQYVQRYMKLQF
jgi:hypothetical protein